jgi:hypothetical protein
MKRIGFSILVLSTFALLMGAGCKRGPSGRQASTGPQREPAPPTKPAPYRYAAPVHGAFHEVNTGRFDLVDGIAYPASSGRATGLLVTSKPIASPVLADSRCPMTQARSLILLRDSGWVEVAPNGSGRSAYFAFGRAFGGSGRESDVGGQEWRIRLQKPAAGHFAGAVATRNYGHFDFDVSLTKPAGAEASQAEWADGKRSVPSAATPAEDAVNAAYAALRAAVVKHDLRGVLAAQGFTEAQITAIRGLDGIDSDLTAFANHFLSPGAPTPGEFTSKPGVADLRSEGVNPKGKKFANYYYFSPCGTALVLTKIAENPQ